MRVKSKELEIHHVRCDQVLFDVLFFHTRIYRYSHKEIHIRFEIHSQ